MRKAIRTLLAVLAAGALLFRAPALIFPDDSPEKAEKHTVRVWAVDQGGDVMGWLKSRAAAYEKSEGRRVYLRSAGEEELALIQTENSGLVPPDVIVGGAGKTVALRGYAVVIRDDTAELPTPAPTALLFSRPASSPGPTDAPPKKTDLAALGAILAPPALCDTLPGCVSCDQPLAGLTGGKADCALLTAGEAAKLTGGYRAVEGSGVFLPINAEPLTKDGADFAEYLGQDASQRALASYGLYSPFLRLYDPRTDALRALIEASLDLSAFSQKYRFFSAMGV